MDWIDWGDAPTFIAALIALGAAVVAIYQAREAKAARKAAENSVVEARRSADAAERANALTEQQIADAAPPEVAWRIEWGGKALYTLRNLGTKDATGVRVDAEKAGPALRNPDEIDSDIPAGGSSRFLMTGGMNTRMPSELWLTWDGCPGPVAVPVPR